MKKYLCTGLLLLIPRHAAPESLDQAYLNVANILRTQGKHTQAIENYKHVIEANPNNVRGH